jgi:hypothetical protein
MAGTLFDAVGPLRFPPAGGAIPIKGACDPWPPSAGAGFGIGLVTGAATITELAGAFEPGLIVLAAWLDGRGGGVQRSVAGAEDSLGARLSGRIRASSPVSLGSAGHWNGWVGEAIDPTPVRGEPTTPSPFAGLMDDGKDTPTATWPGSRPTALPCGSGAVVSSAEPGRSTGDSPTATPPISFYGGMHAGSLEALRVARPKAVDLERIKIVALGGIGYRSY